MFILYGDRRVRLNLYICQEYGAVPFMVVWICTREQVKSYQPRTVCPFSVGVIGPRLQPLLTPATCRLFMMLLRPW